MTMSSLGGGGRPPACDNCNHRKTKCNRESPCSSCTAAGLDCRVSRRGTERRQRVLISSRYDEAMENVDRSLQEVSSVLQKLLEVNQRGQGQGQGQLQSCTANESSPVSFPPLETPIKAEGYRGDSSFNAHVQRLTDALKGSAALTPSSSGTSQDLMPAVTQMIQEAAKPESAHDARSLTPTAQARYSDLECKPLPPMGHVLQLLRLARNETQRLFIDIPVIDVQEVTELCQQVYFAVQDYSIFTWATVNVCLFYLFIDLRGHHYAQVGVTDQDVQAYLATLTANINAVIPSLRLCQEPKLEACQAFDLMATFCNKTGRSAISWSLIAAGSRMCIDLGLHRLGSKPNDPDHVKKRLIFWHTYIMDKGMAFTLGRTPSIPHYDVTTERLTAKDLCVDGAPTYLHEAFYEASNVMGEMHMELFSASALRSPPRLRIERAQGFAERLKKVMQDAKEADANHDPKDPIFNIACDLLDIIMYCLITVAYRIVPCEDANASPLQCNSHCVSAARQALLTIVHGANTLGQHSPSGWISFLSMLFAMVPFACYIVLAGHTIASGSVEDLDLLSTTLSGIEPFSATSASGKKIIDVCKAFYQIASYFVMQSNRPSNNREAATNYATPNSTRQTEGGMSFQMNNPGPLAYEQSMAPQDWNDLTDSLDLGINAASLANFIEPYLPFDGRLP